MQLVLDQVLQQHPTGAVDDGLRLPRGARRVEDVPGVVEGVPLRREGATDVRGEDVGPGVGPRRGLGAEIRHDDRAPEARQPRPDLGQAGQAVVGLAAVDVAVGGDEDGGLDLAEAVEDTRRAEVGRRGREGGADRRRGQHGHDRLGDVGQPGRHPVARSHPGLGQRGGEGRDLRPELVPAQGAAPAVFSGFDQRRTAAGRGQKGLDHVEPGVREEAGVGQGGTG